MKRLISEMPGSGLAVLIAVLGGPDCFAAGPGVMMPQITGQWWTIADDPDLGTYTSRDQEPVDFAVWRAGDGTWQLWSCIRGTKCGGNTRLFHRWETERLEEVHWTARGIAMEAVPALGETNGGLQAPFVTRKENEFLMFYGDWEHICMATSRDGKNFIRQMDSAGRTGLFGEGAGKNTRDPMVLFTRGRWHCYYTAHPQQQGAVYCRRSSDTRTWGAAKVVARGGAAGNDASSAECPFVVELKDGDYYLFRTQRYGAEARTRIYHSLDPMNFGLDSDAGHLVGSLPVAAPELFQHEGQWYMASLLPTLKGIRLAKMEWVPVAESAK